MIGFACSLIPAGFRAILMSFLSFVSQKTSPGDFLRPEVILNRRYLRKCSIFLLAVSSSIYHFLKMPSTLNRLELEANIFRIFISLWYLPLVNISQKSMMEGCHALDDLTWNYPMNHLLLLATIIMITVKTSFTHFHSSNCQENIFLHQNHATY